MALLTTAAKICQMAAELGPHRQGFVQTILKMAGLLGHEGQAQDWCLSSLHLQPGPVLAWSRTQDQPGREESTMGLQGPGFTLLQQALSCVIKHQSQS